MPDLSELLTKQNRTAQENAQLKERIDILQAELSNMRKLLSKTTAGIDADTVDGYHAGTTKGKLFPLPTIPVLYSVTNRTLDRSFDCNATTLDELADVVGNIIQDLINLNIFTDIA